MTMTIADQIIDEAENLAANRILNDPSDVEIIEAVREITQIQFDLNSSAAKLAIASYNRYAVLQQVA